jgi:hypothetical protein
MATSVTQFGITWTFDTSYTVGTYANGDYYVVENTPAGGVTVNSISPAYALDGGTWHKNGSMINPTAGYTANQGFDSSTLAWEEVLNVGDSMPLVLAAGDSLLSSSSQATQANRPQIYEFCVLTVVAAAPAANSFRPPYVGTDKTLSYTVSDLDYSVLQSLAQPNSGTNVPALATVEGYFARSWYEVTTSHEAQDLHPDLNMPNYGREMAYELSDGLLSLHLNYSNAQKETLMIRLVQYGIDIYGACTTGAVWQNDGGHNHGRKAILFLAGLALGDSAILAYGNAANYFIFGEDQQTFQVAQTDVDDCPKLETRECYVAGDIGTYEWGAKHSTQTSKDDSRWAAAYRKIVGSSQLGLTLGASLLGAESSWNWSPLFLYLNYRYWPNEEANRSASTNEIHLFVADMMDDYQFFAGATPPIRTLSASNALLIA